MENNIGQYGAESLVIGLGKLPNLHKLNLNISSIKMRDYLAVRLANGLEKLTSL